MLTMDKSCIVSVNQVDAIKLNSRISTTLTQFISTNGPTRVVNNLAAVLGIDTSQIKIVGLKQGSVIIDYYIDASVVTTSPSDDPNSVLVTDRSQANSILSTST